MIGIYKITNPNNQIYIGQSINIEKRFNNYRLLNCKSQKLIYKSLINYGFKNHIFKIIEECDIELLNERERHYQDFYNVLENGLNCRLTETNDKSGKLSKETKLKISLCKLGNIFSNHTKRKMSLAQSKKILNIKTGILYENAKEVSILFNINRNTLIARLNGRRKNNTNFIYNDYKLQK